MELSSILKPEAVRVLSAASSKKRLFQEIGDVAAATLHLDAQTVVDCLLERESLGPTGVGHGVALPHARLSELDAVTGVFVMLEKPIDFGSVDRQPVDIAFCAICARRGGCRSPQGAGSGLQDFARHFGMYKASCQSRSG